MLFVLLLLLAPAGVRSDSPRDKITAEELIATLDRDAEVTVIDVRTPEEFETGHIPGSISMPLAAIGDGEGIPAGGVVVLYCATGVRSRKALKMLSRNGADALVELEGGIRAWVEAGGNVVVGPTMAMSGYPARFQIPKGVCEVNDPLMEVGN